MQDELRFRDEDPAVGAKQDSWKLLVVDDDVEVHSVTTLALGGLTFGGKPLSFLHAYSGAEARQVLAEQPDVAIMLLDVVMESDHAGLDVVEHVRNTMGNKFLRIILRTGQPGQAPELSVIRRYDINDYKYKTELTRERLFTSVYTAVSTYRDLMALEANRRGLEKVIEASARIFELRSLEHFAQGVLEQLAALLFLDGGGVMLQASGVAAEGGTPGLRIVAGVGDYAGLTGQEAGRALDAAVLARIAEAATKKTWSWGDRHFVGFREDPDGEQMVFYVESATALPPPDQRLLELFCQNVVVARENVRLWSDRVDRH